MRRYDDESLSSPFNKHVLAMKLSTELGAEYMARFRKFAFVRNPYTWMYSWYRFRQRDMLKDRDHPFHIRYTGGKSFDEYVDSFSDDEMFLKQSDFICTHGGELLVDYVGRYENLDADFQKICADLNLPCSALDKVNVSQGNTFSSTMLSVKSRLKINTYFHQDFELFGYEKL